VARAKLLTEDLLSVVRAEHTKMQGVLHQQQMELHVAQAQYAQYAVMGGYAPPPPSGAPPPPPGDQPPLPPGGGPSAASGQPETPTQATPTDTKALADYWYGVFFFWQMPFIMMRSRAQYGYDVNSPQFKEWLETQQQQQYAQYYAAQAQGQPGATATAAPPNEPPPAPPGVAPPPPPPPPPGTSE
jgi:hypothetical protein